MIVGILQARCSSSRLPMKVLKPLLGKEMILRQLERLKKCEKLNEIIVATSKDASDDELESTLVNEGFRVYRGDLDNVLDRFYNAAKIFKPKHLVRLTGDCPLADARLIDEVIEHHLDGGYDYTSNISPPTFPDGLDVEVLSYSSLERAWHYAKLPSELEHVTPYIRNHPEFFKIGNYISNVDLSMHRWTVDEQDDFNFIEKIYNELYIKNRFFDMRDVLQLLKSKPQLMEINYHIIRNQGSLKSFEKDSELLKK